jgi:hemolysin activation/secretion protein
MKKLVCAVSAIIMATSSSKDVKAQVSGLNDINRYEDSYLRQAPEAISRTNNGSAFDNIGNGDQIDNSSDDSACFTLQKLQFTGNSALSKDELEAAYGNLLGTDVCLSDMQRLAGDLTKNYREQGYMLTSSYLPPQEIRNGVVRIHTRELCLSRVAFDGDERLAGSTLLTDVSKKLLNSKPLHKDDLEEALLLINDLPGVQSEAIIKASESNVGEIEAIIQLKEDRFGGMLSADNRGSEFVGPWQGSASINLSGILHDFDRAYVRAVTTGDDELLSVDGGYSLPLFSSAATRLSIRGGKVESEPDVEGISPESEQVYGSIGVEHVFKRTRSENVRGSLFLNARDAEVEAVGVKLSEDKIRSMEANITYDFALSDASVNLFDLTYEKGLDIWDATTQDSKLDHPLSRAAGDAEFDKLTIFASRTQPISDSLSYYLAARGQITSDPLLSSEEFGFGGSEFGRGFDGSEFVGDEGIATLFELRYTFNTEMGFMPAMQLFASYDWGKVWTHDDKLMAGQDDEIDADSVSLGARFSLFNAITASVEVAKPLSEGISAEDGDKDTRVFTHLQLPF